MKYVMIVLLSFYSVYLKAQPCDRFPADCPDNEMLRQLADKKWQGPGDLKIKEEYALQDSLRHFTIACIQELAKNKGWEFYQLEEEQDQGIGMDGNTKPLPYSLRRPRQWGISFVFIVNEDSLHAWQNWYNNDLQNASDKVVESYRQSGDAISQDENRKKYLDSADYYGTQKAKYMTDHVAEYQKAILTGEKKQEKKYEDEMKKYDDKINASINKTNGESENKFSASGSRFDDLETYKHKNTIAFRNASIIRVTLNINDYIAIADDGDKKKTKQLSISASTLSLVLHNDSPDENEIFGQYLRSPDIALLLFGKWSLRQDQYHSYHSTYFSDKKNTDAVTVKRIPCDKVQTIILHVEGSMKYIDQFLQSLDTKKLNDLIVKD